MKKTFEEEIRKERIIPKSNYFIFNYIYSRRFGFIEYELWENMQDKDEIHIFSNEDDSKYIQKILKTTKFRKLLIDSYFPNQDLANKRRLKLIDISYSIVPSDIIFGLSAGEIKGNLESYILENESELEDNKEKNRNRHWLN